jgi:hypothetical protein
MPPGSLASRESGSSGRRRFESKEWKIKFTLGRFLMLYIHRPLVVVGLMLGITLPSGSAIGQISDATQITNPDTLESMGFARDADNVFAGNDALTAAAPDNELAGLDYSALAPREFMGVRNRTGTEWLYDSPSGRAITRAGPYEFADAQFWVPTGAILRSFDIWAFDSITSDLTVFLHEACFTESEQTFVIVTQVSTSGTGGNQSHGVSIPDDRLINNKDCTYTARVRFDAADENLRLQKVRLSYAAKPVAME